MAISMFSGGTIANINNISIDIQISTVGDPNIDTLYGGKLRNRLSKYARERTPAIDYYTLLSALQGEVSSTVLQRGPVDFCILRSPQSRRAVKVRSVINERRGIRRRVNVIKA